MKRYHLHLGRAPGLEVHPEGSLVEYRDAQAVIDGLQALLNERDEKLAQYAEFLAWCENADTAAGYCVCGDSIEAHNSVTSDHGAIDMWHYSLGNWAKELRK